jgi:ABC-2 type transport system ATP-binding protein
MVGLLGPNGAGKTAAVSMIAGLLAPDRGEARIEGGVVRGAGREKPGSGRGA